MTKKTKSKSLNSKTISKIDKLGRRICWWDGCNRVARKYNLCKEHYIEYYKRLHSDIQYGGEDITCLNVNLSNDNLSVTGQWNHGNNK